VWRVTPQKRELSQSALSFWNLPAQNPLAPIPDLFEQPRVFMKLLEAM